MINHRHGLSKINLTPKLNRLFIILAIIFTTFVPIILASEPKPEPGHLANLQSANVNHVDSSNSITTDNLIRNILFNQSAEYYDELVLEQLLAAANMSSPPPETWRTILMLLSKNINATRQQQEQMHKEQHQQQFSLNKSRNSLKNANMNSTLNNAQEIENENITIKKQINKPKQLAQSAIDEFPPDFMSEKTRQQGGFVVHVFIFIYLSIVLAVICDNYFLKSLEYISEALALPSDIAGATFMAIGTSAPELFTSVIGVFISDNDIGTGTIVGSAVFNLIAIPGACGFAAFYNLKAMPKINPFPIVRDTIFYVLTIITLILCIKDNKVDWIESITLIALYIVYIIIMYFNAQISHVVGNKNTYRHTAVDLNEYHHLESNGVHNRNRSLHSMNNIKQSAMDSGNEKSESSTDDNERQPLLSDNSTKRLSPPPAYQSNLMTNYHSLRSDLAGNEQASLLESKFNGKHNVEQVIDLSNIQLALTDDGCFKEISPNELNHEKKLANKGKQELLDLEQSFSMNSDIDTDWTDNSFIQFILFPFRILFFFTLPKPSRFCFVITFASSIIWIACLTYFIVWMVTLIGYTLGIPDTVSGITVLAAGTSIPELISSYLIVKKAGLADMAICNSIGSNIFDILFCLGLPWLLKSSILIMTNGFGLATLANSYIPIQSTALPITSLTLLLTIGAMILIFKTSKWRLNLQLAILCTIVYVIFVVTSTSLELTA